VDDFGFFTLPLAMVISYIVIAAERIARSAEATFGFHEDHLDLESITGAIDISVSDELLPECSPHGAGNQRDG
jgi:predicted membrane chloride channel (bestrophin family)